MHKVVYSVYSWYLVDHHLGEFFLLIWNLFGIVVVKELIYYAAAVRAVGASASSLVAQALSCSSASSFPLSPSSLASPFEVGAARRRVAARRPCLRRRTEKENGNLNLQKDFRSVSAHTRRNKKTNSFSALWYLFIFPSISALVHCIVSQLFGLLA
ncbi:uncharacterized protein DS421_3g61840 [Arachis hypogaea]|nr:uncharacterized protein DS421_3g61840 [Arachis hypogaea]